MRTIVVKDEQNLAVLRGLSPRAEQAVRDANPHLDLDRLRPGSVVVLPDHPDIPPPPERPVPPGAPADAASVLAAARQAVSHATARAENRHAALRHALSGRELAAAASRNDRLRQEVNRVSQALAEAQRRAAQWRDDVSAALDRLQQMDRGPFRPS